jgi:hypothetical protein
VAALIAIETVVLVLLTVLVAGLLRSHASILRQLHHLGADADADAPVRLAEPRVLTPNRNGHRDASDLIGAGLRDDVVSLRVRDVEHRTLLAFLSSGCLTCRTFWDAFAAGGPLGLPDDVRLVVVAKDAAEENLSTIIDLAPSHLPLVMSSDTWTDYEVPGSPYFVLVDGMSGRVVGEGTGASWPQVLGLVGRSRPVRRRRRRAASAPAPAPAPASRRRRRRRDDRRHQRGAHRRRAATRRRPSRRLEPVPNSRRRRTPLVIVTIGVALALAAALRSAWSP